MPRRIQVDSLKSMCIDNICINMKSFWYEKYWKDIYSSPEHLKSEVGPFEYLPACLLNEIAEELNEEHAVGDNIFSALITSPLVKFDLTGFVRRGSLILDLISLKCQDTLKELTLSKCRFENKDLMKAIKSLLKLEVFNLELTNINDEVLAVVGTHCRILRKLSVYGCRCITDKGMEYLFLNKPTKKGVNSYRKCKLLESVDIKGTSVGVSGIKTVLRSAPKLQNLDHPNLVLALGRMHCNDLESNLPLYSLKTLRDEFYSQHYYLYSSLERSLSIATRVCPHVMEVFLRIDRYAQEKDLLRPLCGLKNLKNMDIQYYGCAKPDLSFSKVIPVLSLSGQSITRLHLIRFDQVDVGIIGVCCPQLEDFYLIISYDSGVEESRKEIFIPPASNTKSFSFLKLLNLTLGYPHFHTREDCDITLLQWKEMLSSRLLECLEIKGSSSLTDSLLSEVVAAGQEFPSLRRLDLYMCPNITAEFVKPFLDLPNPLE